MITCNPYYIRPEHLKGIRNMVPDTYPADPIKPEDLVTKAIVTPVPRDLWSGDFLVEMEDGDISWMEEHFPVGVGDYIWVREKHRYHEPKSGAKLVVEFADGEKHSTSLKLDDIRFFDGRWMPPLALHKRAARFVLKIKEIGVRWSDEKKTDVLWVVGIERPSNPSYIIAESLKK